MKFLGCALFFLLVSAFGTCLVLLGWHYMGQHGLLLLAVTLGGIGGGFTLALSGGERYGLKMPARHGGTDTKIDPGYLGDMFVGLMAGLLGVSVCSRNLKTSLFDPNTSSLVDLWFMDFGIAFVSGFLGLRLIKTVSTKFMQEQQLRETHELAEESKELASGLAGTNAFLAGQEALRAGQYDLAEQCFQRGQSLDGETTIRCLIGLGQAYRCMGKLPEAIAILDDAIGQKDRETVKSRVAVAYWNRACYKVLAVPDSERAKESALDDLQQAVQLQDSFRQDLNSEPDLVSLKDDVRLRRLAQEPGYAEAPEV